MKFRAVKVYGIRSYMFCLNDHFLWRSFWIWRL